jgi:protein TonB
MGGQLHWGIAAPIRTTAVRSLARALLLSLCVHAVLIAALWYLISTSLPPPRPLRVEVELTPRAAAVAAAASTAPAPVEKALSDTAPGKIEKPRAEHALHTQQKIASAAPHADALNTIEGNSQNLAATAAASLPATEIAQEPRDAATIDLRVLEWLARYRTYPLAARRARLEGVVQLRVTLMPDGSFVDAHLERSSGHALLDQAALDLLAHVAPLPAEFASARSGRIELRLPIVYRMRASST